MARLVPKAGGFQANKLPIKIESSGNARPSGGHCERIGQAVADIEPGGFFVGRGPMNYPAFTNDSLTMMYEGIRGALASDDALSGLGEEARFRVRETPEWKQHAADLEAEMLRRGMIFEAIDWSETRESGLSS